MPTLTDARFDALRVLVPAAPPTTNDMLRAYLLANGGTGVTLNDLWYSFFIANGSSPGHINDMAKEFLVAEGFTQPHLNDAWLAFWLAGGAIGPSEVVQINDVTQLFQTADPSPNDAAIGYELQNSGFATLLEHADTGGGPPNFTNLNPVTDWVIPRPGVATYHGRWNQTGGNTGPSAGSSAQASWIDLSGGFGFFIEAQGVQFLQILATVDISLNAGSTVHDSCSVDISLDII